EVYVELRQPDDDVVVQIGLEALGGLEEVNLVLDHRAANRTAELMTTVVRLLLARRLRERIDRVQRLVAIELEALAVQLVRAALGRHRHGAAGGPSVFGRRLAQVHLEL